MSGHHAASTVTQASVLQPLHTQLPTNCAPQHHQHQRPKLRSPASNRQDARIRARACTSTPNCMPPSTLPSILKTCARTAISTPNSTPISTYTSTPNCCTPPSTSPSISQITFPSLLEVRTPVAFSYLGKYVSSDFPLGGVG